GVLSSSAVNLAGGSNEISGILPVANGGSPFEQANGSIFERISTQDLLLGGTTTQSAKFAFTGVNGSTQVASIGGTLALSSAGSITTTNGQTLTIGSATTGNIVIDSLSALKL